MALTSILLFSALSLDYHTDAIAPRSDDPVVAPFSVILHGYFESKSVAFITSEPAKTSLGWFTLFALTGLAGKMFGLAALALTFTLHVFTPNLDSSLTICDETSSHEKKKTLTDLQSTQAPGLVR